MTVLCSEDSLLELPSPHYNKRASPDYSSSSEEDEDSLHNNYKRLKTTSTDLLIVFNDDEEEDLFNNSNNNNDTHIVPTDNVLLQLQHTATASTELEYLEGIESSWITSLLDSDRSPIATLEFSFVDDGFSIEGGFLPQEIQVRETASYCLWQSLRMDPSTPVVLAKYVDTNCNGANFRSQLWQTRKSAIIDLPNGWEMHLVAESEADLPMTGYLCPSRLPHLLAQQEMDTLLESKMMAAALDIDDTLVKAISESDMDKYPPNRIHVLNNLPIVVAVASDAELFLKQASNKFKLYLYSVGTPEYVREIGNLLDPHHKLFDWNAIDSGSSSARHEHDHARETSPKKLERIIPFCNTEDGVDYQHCLAVDDNPKAWAPSSRYWWSGERRRRRREGWGERRRDGLIHASQLGGECTHPAFRKRVLRVTSGCDGQGVWDSNLSDVWASMERAHARAMRKLARALEGDLQSDSEEEEFEEEHEAEIEEEVGEQ